MVITHEAWLTKLFNAYLAGFANWFLALFHMQAANPAEPWPDYMVMQIAVAVLLVILFLLLRSRLSMDKPGVFQQVFELIHNFVADEAHKSVGHESRKHIVLFETLFVFILVSNLIGTIPGFMSPTQVIYVPAGCAIISFLYFNLVGVKKHGVGKYLAHFAGPIWWMAPLMFLIEIISTLARPLSLSIRLFANMFAGEKVTLVFISLTYLVVPALFMGLHVFVGLLQAYVFTVLTMMYVGAAVAEAHGHDGGQHTPELPAEAH
ncbi:MAG TPA: F0F1 ATP synthase subunit A [Bryobacteraceae bacterium]|jgi:F-type H+-transporting ATPase subunit a|nr:F0F1 ATP synthase subunit A [Bryobacteraceae bacterium]